MAEFVERNFLEQCKKYDIICIERIGQWRA